MILILTIIKKCQSFTATILTHLSQSRGASIRSSSPVKHRPSNRLTDDDDDDESAISDIDLDTPHTSFETSLRSKSRTPERQSQNHSSLQQEQRQSLARFTESSSREISTSSGRGNNRKNRSYIRLESDLREKQREISALESIVEELNGELQSSQAKLSGVFEKTQKSRDEQRAQMESWRREQLDMMVSPESYMALNEKLAEAAAQLDAVHDERIILAEELDRANHKTRQLQQDRRELKETIEHWKDEVRVRDENIDRIQGRIDVF